MGESPDSKRAGVDASVLEDAKAFNQGKAKLLAAMIAMACTLGGFAYYLVQDQPNPYGELGRQVNSLRSQLFEGYLTCALPNTSPRNLKSDADLRRELDARGGAGARYGAHLRTKCAPSLRELSTRLRTLLPPDDAAGSIQIMASAATKMEAGSNAFADYLENMEDAYSASEAEREHAELVRGWYEFRSAHSELNRLVKEKLGR